MKIIFFGTADFGIPALEGLIKSGNDVCAVVTNPPKPAGRGLTLRETPIARYCSESFDGPVLTPGNLRDTGFLDQLKAFDADLFVVVAFSILPKEIFTIAPQGTYNIHAALLPLFRGPAPIQRAIESGVSETGVTVFRIDIGIDTGNIVLQKTEMILDDDTTPSLYKRLSELGGIAIVEAITYISDGKIELKEQNHANATKAPLLKKSEAEVDWSMSAVTIDRRVRAFKPFPGTFTKVNSKRLGLETVAVCYEETHNEKPGTILTCQEGCVKVACGDGVLSLLEIKPEGKRKMTVGDYLNGSPLTEGYVLG